MDPTLSLTTLAEQGRRVADYGREVSLQKCVFPMVIRLDPLLLCSDMCPVPLSQKPSQVTLAPQYAPTLPILASQAP